MTATTGAKPHPIFLAGKWVESDDPLVVVNPADAENPAGATFHATEAQYEEAVQAAVDAFETTRNLPAFERGAILRNISAGIKARREELGRLIALEAGKPIRDALVEVDRATLTFRLGAEEAERMVGETIPLDLMPASKGRVGISRRVAFGPIAAFSPFYLRLNLAAH
jgi:glyceraldehyde-3-phosphate dehydrogenase (NADP+)